ncbi:MAG TPA: winged helix-turn-helix domain-containing protein [Candidatus Nanoarchaeia archaeon]|nr:winged helix-turn-helix domain-containing protein [Candidatus Nanoarchaeia archaeon]
MKTELRQPYKTFFGTLANQYRLDIIEALMEKPMNVTQISRKTNFGQPTVSHNLQRLQRCGYVFVKARGKERIYELNKGTIKPLLILMSKHMKNYCEHNLID